MNQKSALILSLILSAILSSGCTSAQKAYFGTESPSERMARIRPGVEATENRRRAEMKELNKQFPLVKTQDYSEIIVIVAD